MNQLSSPLITTIIPTYQRPESLKKAIQSVLNQTYQDFQVCIYDNCSQDSTADVVKAFKDPRIKYHCHSSNIGAVENFQYGLDRIQTPFFSFLSDDDFLLPEFYETAFDMFTKHPDIGFFIGAVIDVNEKQEIIDIILNRWPEKEYFLPDEGLLEMIGKYSNWTGILFRREVIEKVGALDSKLKAIDIDFVLRAAARMPFAVCKKPCAVFVQHNSSYSGQNGLKLIWPGWSMMIAKLDESPLLQETKAIAGQKLHTDLQQLLFMNILRALEKKKFSEAWSILEIYQLNYGKKGKKLLLKITVKICQTFSMVQAFIVLLLKLRRYCRRKSNMFFNDKHRLQIL